MVVLFPLMFVSNAFVPVETMPGWLRWFAEINPISHMIAAVRGMVNQGTMNADFAISLLGAAAIVAIFAPIAVRVYMRRV
jgi:ABC-2 type transport system permease protein